MEHIDGSPINQAWSHVRQAVWRLMRLRIDQASVRQLGGWIPLRHEGGSTNMDVIELLQ